MEVRYGAPVAGSEKEVLAGFLDHYRRMILDVCSGLTEEQLRAPMVASGTSLLGMVKHLAFVERGWFQETVAGEKSDLFYDESDPEMDFRIEDDETSEDIFEMYRNACERSRRALDEAELDDMVRGTRRSRDYNVRWVAMHMLEEIARHVGHADILREQIDGRTGTGYED
jgi:uncharacterized damage-inducible protein DinB